MAAKMTCVVGIDPGLDGAIAVLSEDIVEWKPTPVVTVEKGRREYNVHAMWQLLAQLPDWTPVCLERQWAQARRGPQGLRREGVTQSFRLGYGYGLWYGLIHATGHRIFPVAPITWKRHFGLLKQSKQAGLLKLHERCITPAGKITDGGIDALLLAQYLVDVNNGGTHGRTATPSTP